jgi:hypothetical protein
MRHSTSDRPDLRVLYLETYYGVDLLHHTVVALCPFLFWPIFNPCQLLNGRFRSWSRSRKQLLDRTELSTHLQFSGSGWSDDQQCYRE